MLLRIVQQGFRSTQRISAIGAKRRIGVKSSDKGFEIK
jgi:hypothetical protein